jgi:hypothetical protein
MEKPEILEMPNFEYTTQGFSELKAALKEGKIVRNPFAKFYGEKVEVTVNQDIIQSASTHDSYHVGS